MMHFRRLWYFLLTGNFFALHIFPVYLTIIWCHWGLKNSLVKNFSCILFFVGKNFKVIIRMKKVALCLANYTFHYWSIYPSFSFEIAKYVALNRFALIFCTGSLHRLLASFLSCYPSFFQLLG